MGNVNKVILLGNLGADPELKPTASGRACCHLRLATNAVFKDAAGQRQEKTEWHRVTAWGPVAEQCVRYLRKGRGVYIEGRLESRSWDGEDGKKRWATDVIANRVVFLSTGNGAGTGTDPATSEAA